MGLSDSVVAALLSVEEEMKKPVNRNTSLLKIEIDCRAWVDPDDVPFRRKLFEHIKRIDKLTLLDIHRLLKNADVGLKLRFEIDDA